MSENRSEPHFPAVWIDDDLTSSSASVDLISGLAPVGCTVASTPPEADVALISSGSPVPVGLPPSAGLVVLHTGTTHRELAALADTAGIGQAGIAIGPRPMWPENGVAALVAPDRSPGSRHVAVHHASSRLAEDLLAQVHLGALTATGALTVSGEAAPVLCSSDGKTVVAAQAVCGDRSVVVLAVRPNASAKQLIVNSLVHAARRAAAPRSGADRAIAAHPAWLRLKTSISELRTLQVADGSLDPGADQRFARALVTAIITAVEELSPSFPHDGDYLAAVVKDLTRWADGGFGVPDFLDSLLAFHPERQRIDGREHLVLFPMCTQNGNPKRNLEAVLVQVIWPDFVADLESRRCSNKLFVPIRFLDYTPGYDSNSAVLFPETIAMREVPVFSWGAIFADREAARFRSVVSAAADITRLSVPPEAARLLADQELAERTFVMWDLIHDRTHMRGDLPFDPFMIKQRMPYFLYTLEELRCDLTAFRESVELEKQGNPYARLVRYAILFDRIFRFAITGARVRNYDGLGGQLLFAWLHQHRVLHWTDNRLTIDWSAVTEPVLELGRQIEELYWHSIDRPKTAHWLAAYRLVSSTVTPHPASVWARGAPALPLDGPPKGLTDAVLPDEFPLSMFYEALDRKLAPVVAATSGITG